MDEAEADYLRRQAHELRQANTRWKALALLSLCALAFLVLLGGATLLTGGLVMGQRMRDEAMRAREAEMEAREQAEQARMQAEQARDAEMAARKRAEAATRLHKEPEKPTQRDRR
jgi:hypothetical protein